MNGKKIWIAAMFVLIGIFAIFRMASISQEEIPEIKEAGTLSPPEAHQDLLCALCDRLLLLAVTLPFLITIILLTVKVLSYE